MLVCTKQQMFETDASKDKDDREKHTSSIRKIYIVPMNIFLKYRIMTNQKTKLQESSQE